MSMHASGKCVCRGGAGDGACDVYVAIVFVGQREKVRVRGRRELFCNECTSLVSPWEINSQKPSPPNIDLDPET